MDNGGYGGYGGSHGDRGITSAAFSAALEVCDLNPIKAPRAKWLAPTNN